MKLPHSGLVLAGGRSSRMGRDKALLEVDGMPMWQRQRNLLQASGAAEILLSARPEQTWAYSAPGFSVVVNDALPDCGPIVGITAGLERASHAHLAVLAIDLPKMAPAWFSQLLGQCAPSVGVVGQRDGFVEPLAAVYPEELKWLAWESIAAGQYSLQQLVRKGADAGLLKVVDIDDAQADWFLNWNEEKKG